MLGVVGSDPGGIEIISSYVRRNSLSSVFCVEGPAKNIITRKLGPVQFLTLDQLIHCSEWILCGTSTFSDLEWTAIALARRAGKRCVVALDHWINYRKRFLRHGEWHWPDEVWVADQYAARIASEELPGIPQTLVPNAYLLDIQDEINNIIHFPKNSINNSNILYVSEPLREASLTFYNDERFFGYTEEDALVYFLSHVNLLSDHINSIVIRTHPKEPIGKYDWALSQFDLPLIFGEQASLVDQILKADIVVGCSTMAMVVALLAGKRVVSCIPPGGKTQRLPHPEIEYMVDMHQNIFD